jgi:eukaryotic-like serine/threonine-protein kinase
VDPTAPGDSNGETRTLGQPAKVEADASAKPRQSLPGRIGNYRIVRLLGEGGMGAVYEAEQDQPRRIVALKVIKSAWASPSLLHRFEQESAALARLHHPGIAQVYEAGTADSGTGTQPYFAMEYIVGGQTLTEHAKDRGLNTEQRLNLIAEVCDAVQHAHQRGIIHRDLKPGNILVDEHGHPKILDFGVARITDSDTQATRQTDVGQLVGTLAYMSPEQALADPLALDTRSDVYALGVILYELLAGKLPYDLSNKLHEAVLTIREKDATSLSSVSRIYRGDIETVVAKAMEKDKARRYASAADLAADIRRHLKDEPIVARPASAGYQLYKFSRRHRALVGGIAAVFVVLLGGIVVSTLEAARARGAEHAAVLAGQTAAIERDHARTAEQQAIQERNRAVTAEHQAEQDRNRARDSEVRALNDRNLAVEQKKRAATEAATAAAVNNFLQNDLLAQASNATQATPDSKPDPNLTVRMALDRAATRVEGKFTNQPLVEAAIRQTLGHTYSDLGAYPEAEKHLQRAIDLRSRILGPEHQDTLESQLLLADCLNTDLKPAQAEPLMTKVLEIERRLFGESDPRTLEAISTMGYTYVRQGKYPEAEALLRPALDRARRALDNDDPALLLILTNLAPALANQGKLAQAATVEIDLLQASRRVNGPEHPHTVGAMQTLASYYARMRQLSKAAELYQQVIEIQGRVRGADHPNRLLTMGGLARLYQLEGKFEESKQLYLKLIAAWRRVGGDEDSRTLTAINNLTIVYSQQGQYADAERLLENLLAIRQRVSGEEGLETLTVKQNLAATYVEQGKYEQAEPMLNRVLEVRRRVLGAEDPQTLSAMGWLASVYVGQGKYGQAEPMLNSILEVRRRVSGAEHLDTLIAMNALAAMYQRQGRNADADALYAKVAEAARRTLGPQHAETLSALSGIGSIRIQLRKYAEAEPVLREVLAGSEKSGPNEWRRYSSLSLLGESLSGQGKYAEAEPLLLGGYAGLIERESAIPMTSRDNLQNAGTWIVELYRNWGKPEIAADWKQRVQERKPASPAGVSGKK